MGFSLRQTGDYPTALTFYKKALDFDADHKGAHEYLGELYVETGNVDCCTCSRQFVALCVSGVSRRYHVRS